MSEHSSFSIPETGIAETGGRVLVVDDNDFVRRLLCLELETAGFEVHEAACQIELQRRLTLLQPDVVLLDLQRSAVDGVALLLRLRARQTLHDVPIVFLAASDDADFRQQAMRAGADWFGLRPLGMLQLQTQLARLIRNGRPASGRRCWPACLARR
jgi:two-component system chemotaxis response regulator CheY